jgi:hypothetical protein
MLTTKIRENCQESASLSTPKVADTSYQTPSKKMSLPSKISSPSFTFPEDPAKNDPAIMPTSNIMKLFTHPIASGLYGALGPFFNKQIGFGHYSDTSMLWRWAINYQVSIIFMWLADLAFLAAMLTVNTMAVKYKMLSFKRAGSFISNTIIFTVSVMSSLVLDLVLAVTSDNPLDDEKLFKRVLALILISTGVGLISIETQKAFAETDADNKLDIYQNKTSITETTQKAAELTACTNIKISTFSSVEGPNLVPSHGDSEIKISDTEDKSQRFDPKGGLEQGE